MVYEGADGGGLWVVSIFDEGKLRHLTPSGFVPNVSPDGEWIAYFDANGGIEITEQVNQL